MSINIGRSPREGERKKVDGRKMSKQSPPALTASAIGPCPTIIQISRTLGTESLPSTIALPDHPLKLVTWPFSEENGMKRLVFNIKTRAPQAGQNTPVAQ